MTANASSPLKGDAWKPDLLPDGERSDGLKLPGRAAPSRWRRSVFRMPVNTGRPPNPDPKEITMRLHHAAFIMALLSTTAASAQNAGAPAVPLEDGNRANGLDYQP